MVNITEKIKEYVYPGEIYMDEILIEHTTGLRMRCAGRRVSHLRARICITPLTKPRREQGDRYEVLPADHVQKEN